MCSSSMHKPNLVFIKFYTEKLFDRPNKMRLKVFFDPKRKKYYPLSLKVSKELNTREIGEFDSLEKSFSLRLIHYPFENRHSNVEILTN